MYIMSPLLFYNRVISDILQDDIRPVSEDYISNMAYVI
jgi:hypothetical protein